MHQLARALTARRIRSRSRAQPLISARKVGVPAGQHPIIKLDVNCGAAAIVLVGNDFYRISMRSSVAVAADLRSRRSNALSRAAFSTVWCQRTDSSRSVTGIVT
jgi:hypothetical protein